MKLYDTLVDGNGDAADAVASIIVMEIVCFPQSTADDDQI